MLNRKAGQFSSVGFHQAFDQARAKPENLVFEFVDRLAPANLVRRVPDIFPACPPDTKAQQCKLPLPAKLSSRHP
jgi:hypothetical protein